MLDFGLRAGPGDTSPATLGADVVKIESPRGPTARFATAPPTDPEWMSTAPRFTAPTRNARSRSTSTPAGRDRAPPRRAGRRRRRELTPLGMPNAGLESLFMARRLDLVTVRGVTFGTDLLWRTQRPAQIEQGRASHWPPALRRSNRRAIHRRSIAESTAPSQCWPPSRTGDAQEPPSSSRCRWSRSRSTWPRNRS